MLFVLTGQTYAGDLMSCDIPADITEKSTSILTGHDKSSHDMMSMEDKSEHTQAHCPDCDCPMGSCSLILPAEVISCGPPRPQNLTPDYPEFPELEQVSSLYRPPISR